MWHNVLSRHHDLNLNTKDIMKKISKILTAVMLCTALTFTSTTLIYSQNDNARTTQNTDDDDDDQDWGWIGLIGLAGLLGLRRRDRDVHHDRDTTVRGTRV